MQQTDYLLRLIAENLAPQLALPLDFGLFLVLWLVQLIIYPGFYYSTDTSFISWHFTYVKRIMLFVLPLMGGQLTIHAASFYAAPSLPEALILLFILIAWTVSLSWSVSCHIKLHKQGRSAKTIRSLLLSNLLRAICWTVVFLLSLYMHWPT